MKTTGIIGGMAIIAATLLAGIAGASFGLGRIRQALIALDPDPQTSLILGSAAIVALLSAWLIGAAIRSAAKREIENRRAESLAPSYESIIASLDGRTPAPKRAQHLLFLKGSATVLKEYRTLLALEPEGDHHTKRVNRQISRLLLAMRRDLGGTTLGLEQEDWSGWLRPAADRTREKDDEDSGPVELNGSSSFAPVPRL